MSDAKIGIGPFEIGDRVRITGPGTMPEWVGLTGTITNERGMKFGDSQTPAALFRPDHNRPDSHGVQEFWWNIKDLELIDEHVPTDEEILALFQVAPHEHECVHCGMRMGHD